jgi:hypothetical protein
MKNPFPGMNPWMEGFWRDVHASMLVYARDLLNAELPPGLHARVDERLAVDAEEDKAHNCSHPQTRRKASHGWPGNESGWIICAGESAWWR